LQLTDFIQSGLQKPFIWHIMSKNTW